jgi:hypothetical protein
LVKHIWNKFGHTRNNSRVWDTIYIYNRFYIYAECVHEYCN